MVKWEQVSTDLGWFWTSSDQQREELVQVVEEQVGELLRYRDGECRVHERDVVIDVGAHLGVFTRCALLAGADTVVAIEPEPSVCEAFRRTFQHELMVGKAKLVQAAAVDCGARQHLTGTGIRGTVEGCFDDPGIDCAGTTIDAIVSELGHDGVDFIKLDIEGAEWRGLAGAEETIRRHKPNIACCVYHRDYDPEEVTAAVRAIRTDYWITCSPVPSWMTRPPIYFFHR